MINITGFVITAISLFITVPVMTYFFVPYGFLSRSAAFLVIVAISVFIYFWYSNYQEKYK